MKHFIYTDSDIINSYLSQINDGLIKSIKTEVTDEVCTSSGNDTTEENSKLTTEIGFKPLLNFKFSDDPNVMKTTNTLSQLESGKELIEKLLHDNSLQLFTDYLESNNMMNTLEDCSIGDYVQFTGDYIIRDLDYIISVYSDEFIRFLSEQNLENVSDKIKKLKISTAKKEHENTRRIFNIAKQMIPTSKFIICNNCFIPLDEKFLRQTTNSIKFNYSGKLTVLARYTSTLLQSVSSKPIKATSSFDDMFDSFDDINKIFYCQTLGIDINSRVLIPIALYFE